MSETSIDMMHGDKVAIWYSSSPSVIKRMKEYVKNYPDEVKVRYDYTDEEHVLQAGEMAYEIECPKHWFRMPKPPAKREMTEEHKEKIQKALRDYRANKKSEAGK